MDESQNIEFKESWRDEYLKWICGFANANGGKIYIGLENDAPHNVVELPDTDKLMEVIPNKVRDVLGIMVDVNLLNNGDKNYIEISVEPYPYPVTYKGQYHYRSGSTKQELKGAALNKFLLDKIGVRWCNVPVPTVKPDDLSAESIKDFKESGIRTKRMDVDVLADSTMDFLSSLDMMVDGQITRAGVLMFHPKPEKLFPGAFIKIGFFKTDSDLLFQDEIHGSLVQQIGRTFDLLSTKYMNYMISYEGLQRVENPSFPEGPLRECILNSVSHKDYAEQIPIQISVYPDRIVFWNPGSLPESWTVDNLLKKHPSRAFNPAIANAFFRCGEIEAWGRGIGKIVNGAIADKLLPPIFDTAFGGLMVTFFNSPAAQLEKAGVDDRGITIVNYVLTEKKVTNSDVQKLLKVSKPTATRILTSLSDYLVVTGTRGKGTFYSLKGLTIGSHTSDEEPSSLTEYR
ncbi:MAG: putative DNA binding domain-containing protein [Bacteroidales bacterium]|nr:putative DNA binding domain-containing protein [Bacteroidales bacterium]